MPSKQNKRRRAKKLQLNVKQKKRSELKRKSQSVKLLQKLPFLKGSAQQFSEDEMLMLKSFREMSSTRKKISQML